MLEVTHFGPICLSKQQVLFSRHHRDWQPENIHEMTCNASLIQNIPPFEPPHPENHAGSGEHVTVLAANVLGSPGLFRTPPYLPRTRPENTVLSYVRLGARQWMKLMLCYEDECAYRAGLFPLWVRLQLWDLWLQITFTFAVLALFLWPTELRRRSSPDFPHDDVCDRFLFFWGGLWGFCVST